jgi:hypothetical protein
MALDSHLREVVESPEVSWLRADSEAGLAEEGRGYATRRRSARLRMVEKRGDYSIY